MWECETQRVNETAAAPLASSEEMKGLKGNSVVSFPPPSSHAGHMVQGVEFGVDVGLDLRHQRRLVKQNIQ